MTIIMTNFFIIYVELQQIILGNIGTLNQNHARTLQSNINRQEHHIPTSPFINVKMRQNHQWKQQMI